MKEVKRVLILNVYGPLSSPGVALMDQAIVTDLEKSPYQVELYSENLDAVLFPDEASQQQFRDWYIRKYRDRKPDVIITVGPEPLKFMVEVHESAFPNIPIIFCGSTEEMLDQMKLDSHFTGVWGVAEPEKTLKAALQLQPGTRHVVVVGGTGDYDRHLEAIAREAFHKYESSLEFTYLTDLDMPTLLERLRHLPDHTIVYHTSIMQDVAGTRFIDASQSVPMIVDAANAPVFVVDDVDIGKGTVGGYVLSFAAQGRAAAAMAVRVLNGERPESIPVVKSANIYMFDWRAMRRFGLKESNLPSGSMVLNREPTLWEAYRRYILGAVVLILFEALLIFGLLWQRARRRRVETELATASDRLRLAVESAKSSAWDWDIKSGQVRWFGDLQTIFGIPSYTHLGDIDDFRSHLHPEDREPVRSAIDNARQNQEPFVAEFRVIRNDQNIRWIGARGRFYYVKNGHAERMLGMVVDITERKMAEAALARLTGRLIETQEEERRRIAREIHDDYNQRLAVLANELEDLAQSIGNSVAEAGPRLHSLWTSVSELGIDLHSLSHRLHSSTLETLGLVAGVRAFCEEFEDLQQIQVEFTHDNVPRVISTDVSLCLFRVAQEALRNVKRHSGASRAEVHLEFLGGRLHLSVCDQGRGFNPSKRSEREGIGIRSMEERLNFFGGQLEVHSQPMAGTRIDAWVPFKVFG